MKAEIKARWTKALRSGEYTQGTGTLARRANDGTYRHCCLGVLCDLAVKDGVIPTKLVETKHGEDVRFGYSSFSTLPLEVSQWAEVKGEDPVVAVSMNQSATLSLCNDDLKMNFEAIASLIEEQL